MERIKYGPDNSIVFVHGEPDCDVPTYPLNREPGEILAPVITTSTCLSVIVFPQVDGDTEFFFGSWDEVGVDGDLAFDGFLETRNKTIVVDTVEGKTLFQTTVAADKARIRVWRSHPRWPDTVRIAID